MHYAAVLVAWDAQLLEAAARTAADAAAVRTAELEAAVAQTATEAALAVYNASDEHAEQVAHWGSIGIW